MVERVLWPGENTTLTRELREAVYESIGLRDCLALNEGSILRAPVLITMPHQTLVFAVYGTEAIEIVGHVSRFWTNADPTIYLRRLLPIAHLRAILATLHSSDKSQWW